MWRWLAAVLIGLGLLLCGGGFWMARGAAVAPFVLPQASDTSVRWQGLGALTVSYHAPDEPFAWRTQLGRRLSADGWYARSYPNVGAKRPPFVTVWYTRQTCVGFVLMTERAIFANLPDEPNTARIEVHRDLEFAR